MLPFHSDPPGARPVINSLEELGPNLVSFVAKIYIKTGPVHVNQ